MNYSECTISYDINLLNGYNTSVNLLKWSVFTIIV